METEMIDITPYMNKRTLILGDINSGKTEKTVRILQEFIRAGYSEEVAVLDLSPEPVNGVGGKMPPPSDGAIVYLTANIIAPRITGRTEKHIRDLARQNARAIDMLFAELKKHEKKILFVNDATLYFHAGNLAIFLKMLEGAATQIINAYRGDTFKETPITRREKQLTKKLMATCNILEYLP